MVRRLQDAGYDCRILSGDRAEAVAPVAAALGIANWAAGVRPAEKIAALEALAAAGRRVAMVGDGLNDAPALAAAHVSLSPIGASDLALAQADGVFLGRRLEPVAEAVAIARRARRLMTANLGLFGRLQSLRRPARDFRAGDAAHRRAGDVGLFDRGHPQRAARASARTPRDAAETAATRAPGTVVPA